MKLSGDSGLVLNDKTELHKLSKKLQKNLQRCGTATSTHWSEVKSKTSVVGPRFWFSKTFL